MRRTRTYGLSPYDADILVREREHADYFEDFVAEIEKHKPLSAELCQKSAKFIINELMAGAKRRKVDLTAIPIPLAVDLLVRRMDGKIKNQEIKTALAEMTI